MKPKYPIVQIEWLDAYSKIEWRKDDDVIEDAIMFSAGYLICEGEKYTQIAQSVSPEGKIAHALCVPRQVIIKIRKLK